VLNDKLARLKDNIVSEKEVNIEEKLNKIAKATGRNKFEYKPPKSTIHRKRSFSSKGGDTIENKPALKEKMSKTAFGFHDNKAELVTDSHHSRNLPKEGGIHEETEEVNETYEKEGNFIKSQNSQEEIESLKTPSTLFLNQY